MDWSGYCIGSAVSWTNPKKGRNRVPLIDYNKKSSACYWILSSTLHISLTTGAEVLSQKLDHQCLGFSLVSQWYNTSGKIMASRDTKNNDLFLMDTIMNHLPHFPPKTIKRLHACSIFLQVITLVNITDGSGCDILKCSLMGVRNSDRCSSYKWPKQIRPSSEAWWLWQHTLTTLFCKSPESTKLRQSLGA